MSDFRVALVAEGPTDAVVIEAALKALLPRPFILTRLQPEPTRPKLGTGWGGVLRWCVEFASRGSARFEDDATLPGFDLFVFHVDADVADMSYTDVADEFARLAEERGWPSLPCPHGCPPSSASADAIRSCILSWAGLSEPGPNTVLCVPSKAVESWLTAAVFPAGHAILDNLECNLRLESQLKALPKAQRIKKSGRRYRELAPTVTASWDTVRARCTQAERFSTDLTEVLS